MSTPPLISVNTLCLPPGSLAAHIDMVARLGGGAISPDIEAFAELTPRHGARLLREACLAAPIVTHRAFGFVTAEIAAAQRTRLSRTIEIAHAIGAQAVCLTTGGRGTLPWGEAAARFKDAIAFNAEQARAAGIVLGIEPTSHLYSDVSLVHRLADVVTLARESGVGVGIDLFACWVDSDIEDAIAASGPVCAFVQVSDYVPGDRGLPCRAVPGDGAVPLRGLIRAILETGFRGPFDIEVIGPRLVAEGEAAGLRRAITHLAGLIDSGMRGLENHQRRPVADR